jgi:hypothetical protein
MKMLPSISLLLLLLTFSTAFSETTAWSIGGHAIVTKLATNFLPRQWSEFFKYYDWLLREASQYPDTLYRPSDPNEAPRHFIDLEIWNPNDHTTGTLPQAVEEFSARMTADIRTQNWNDMFLDAGRVSHYMADVAQPYHTTKDYNPISPSGVHLHQLLDASMEDHFSELKIMDPSAVGALTPVENVTQFALRIAFQSHTFLSRINRVLVDEGLSWSPELTGIIENRTNTAIISVARVWYTAIVRAESSPPTVPQPNRLTIVVVGTEITDTLSIVRLRVVDALGVKTYAYVTMNFDGSVIRAQAANVVVPVGEYVIVSKLGDHSGPVSYTAYKEGYESVTVTFEPANSPTTTAAEMKSPSSADSSESPIGRQLPLQTVIGLVGIIVSLTALAVHLERTRFAKKILQGERCEVEYETKLHSTHSVDEHEKGIVYTRSSGVYN